MRQVARIAAACVLALLAMAGRLAGQASTAEASGLDVPAFVRDVGFPAAAFVMLYWLVWRSLAENTRAIRELSDIMVEVRGYLIARDKEIR